MDALIFTAQLRELSPKLAGGRINKIHQPSRDELLLRLWSGAREHRLYLRARADAATFYLTDRRFANPFTPPRFCQLLRARLSRLEGVEQWHAERLAVLTFSGKSMERYRLLVDFRRMPNLILLADDARVVDALHRDPSTGAVPGGSFIFPVQHPISLLQPLKSINPPEVPDVLRSWLLHEVSPMTSWLADAIVRQVRAGKDPIVLLVGLHEGLMRDAFAPVMLELSGRSRLLPFLPAWADTPTGKDFPSISRGLEFLDAGGDVQAVHDPLRTVVNRAIDRLERRRVRIDLDRARLDELDRLQHLADLLLSHRHLLRRGMTSVVVEDYLETPPTAVSIPLDERMTPQQNIEFKFKRIRKLRRGAEHFARRALETDSEVTWLEEMRLAIDECRDDIERDQLSRELASAGYLHMRQEPAKRSRHAVPEPLLRSTSPGGYELVWGRNPRGNEQVSHQLAQGEDLWFHVHQRPGCHLLLRKAGRREEVPDQDVAYAAALAAGYSAARNETFVEVMVASAADVRKPKGVRPGLVSVARFRTVRVAPLRLTQDLDNG